jgi:putative ABC transport system ATP-binding protein
MAVVDTRKLCKTYEIGSVQLPALRDVDLKIEQGQYIELPMFYQGFSEEASAERARELAILVGLGDRIKHRPSELSGGQQQRVAIARALANDPLIILADEPTGNLDSESGDEILNILGRLNQQGKTLIAVTHDDSIAARAERTICLFDGHVKQ